MHPASVYLNSTQTITTGPAEIIGVFLAGDGAAADAQIYDGKNADSPQKLHIEAPSGDSTPFFPPLPVRCERGIHVVVNATTSKLTIQYRPLAA